jgi:hypothetical protein
MNDRFRVEVDSLDEKIVPEKALGRDTKHQIWTTRAYYEPCTNALLSGFQNDFERALIAKD